MTEVERIFVSGLSGPVICFILCVHTCMLTTPSCPLYVHTHWCDVGKLSVSWPTLAEPAALWVAVSLWVWYIRVFVAHTSLLCLYVCAHVCVLKLRGWQSYICSDIYRLNGLTLTLLFLVQMIHTDLYLQINLWSDALYCIWSWQCIFWCSPGKRIVCAFISEQGPTRSDTQVILLL